MTLPPGHSFAGLPAREPETFPGGRVTLHAGDCLDVMAQLAGNSIDVCDPPYHLTSIVKRFGAENAKVTHPATDNATGAYVRHARGFMGKTWDGGDIAFRPETWAAVCRVLKPGACIVAFGGTRTFDMLGAAIRAGGFEIRDTIMWLYGSGFPKSHDVAQSIEKLLTTGAARRPDRDLGGLPRNRFSGDIEGTLIANTGGKVKLTTGEARQREGWGTALKPACELIVLARKPLSEDTVAANVLRWGTGALNIDGCRVGTSKRVPGSLSKTENTVYGKGLGGYCQDGSEGGHNPNIGRWPANLVHDGSEEVLAAFPDALGQQGLVKGTEPSECHNGVYSGPRARQGIEYEPRDDSGSAARFFAEFPGNGRYEKSKRLWYGSKADHDDRLGSSHPTIKPVDLMRWLVRLVCPPGGTVLDCFAGTGTTGEAAFREGMRAILIEREAAYQQDIRRRMALVMAGPDERVRESIKAGGKAQGHDDLPLFSGMIA